MMARGRETIRWLAAGFSLNRALAQPWTDDVVLAAALFKPNAAGNLEFGVYGFGRRQILKARGVYLAERVLLAVTPIDVYALHLVLGRWVLRPLGRWRRAELGVTLLEPCGDGENTRCTALLLTNQERALAALQAVRPDDEAERVVDLLLDGGRVQL
jgi:hypothetical protein